MALRCRTCLNYCVPAATDDGIGLPYYCRYYVYINDQKNGTGGEMHSKSFTRRKTHTVHLSAGNSWQGRQNKRAAIACNGLQPSIHLFSFARRTKTRSLPLAIIPSTTAIAPSPTRRFFLLSLFHKKASSKLQQTSDSHPSCYRSRS